MVGEYEPKEEMERVEEPAEVERVAEKREEVMEMVEEEKEQGPFLDLVDKISDKETTLNIDIEDVGGRLFGRTMRLTGKVNIGLGTLKEAK